MINDKQDLLFYMEEDAKANRIPSKFIYFLKLLSGGSDAHALRYLRTVRKYEYYSNINSPLKYFFQLRFRRLSFKYGLYIPINTVGYGLWIPHFQGGVVINCISMGNHCSISSGVVIGNKNGQENRAIIGNNVEIDVGAKVIGKLTIGSNSIIAPNSVVIKDVPENAVVSGVPAQLIKLNGKKVVQ